MYENYSASKLRELCTEKGYKNISRLKKKELLDLLNDNNDENKEVEGMEEILKEIRDMLKLIVTRKYGKKTYDKIVNKFF